MRAVLATILGLATFLIVPLAVAQEAPVRVVLVDGTVLVGTVVNANADPVVVVTADGIEQRVPQARIREITPLIRGRFTRTDPAATRMFVAPTARTLGQGRGRFSAFMILPSVAYGPTDFLDLTAGMTVPTVSDGEFGLAATAGIKAQPVRFGDSGALAVGTTVGFPIITAGPGGGGLVGTLYAVGTMGPTTGSATFGLFGAFGGFGLETMDGSNDGLTFADGVGILAAADRQISNNVKLMTENYLFVGGDTAFATLTGVRFFGERVTGDIAVVASAGGGGFFISPIPYVGFSYAFGR